jgi:TolB protein
MTQTKLLTAVITIFAAIAVAAQKPEPLGGGLYVDSNPLPEVQTGQPPAQPPTQPPAGQKPGQQPDIIDVSIAGVGGPPKFAIPELVPLTNDPETVKAAKTIGDVLFDDIAFEKEFYMIPKDIMRTIPKPLSPDQISLDRWKEVGADGVVLGFVRRSGDGVVVELRLMQVSSGKMVLGKQYSGSLKSVADGGRMYAHTFADEVHTQQRALRGVARTKLAYSSDRDGGQVKGPVGSRGVSAIYMADYDGANEKRVTFQTALEISPVWSPDAKSIAYTSYRDGFPDILISRIYEGKPPERPIRAGKNARNYLPAWSQDGSRIAYMSARGEDGNTEIYVANRDGSNEHRVTNHPMADSTPTWAPNGNQLAFVSDRTGSPQVYIVNVDGTELRRISTESYCDRPTWSPAPLNQIAYTCRGGGGYQIMVFDFAKGSSYPIGDGIGSNESPAFAPNGRHIAFTSDRTGRPQIYTMARDGTDLRQITRTGSNKYPNWSQ